MLRPILIVPMAPSGLLAGSDLLPVALAVVVVTHFLIAIGVLVGNRPAIAFGLFTALAGVPLALLGASVGLPAPSPLALLGYNAALAAVGIQAWRAPRPAAGG